jgi:TonB family protein
VAVGTTIGAAAGGAYVVSASGGLVSAAFVAPAVAAVALPAIVVGVAMNRNASAVDEEIVRRHTVLPLEVAGGQDARLDVFFPVTKVPTRLVVAYAGADGNHDLELDTREQLATIHMEPPPRLERRIEPDFPQDAIAAGIASGHVVARLDLNADGGVTSVRILESEPPGVFDHEATRALFRWKYSETLALRRWARSEDVRLDFRR